MITIPHIGVSDYVSSHSDASYIEKKTVSELYKQMKEQNHAAPTRSLSSAANLTSLCVDISPSLSNFFEVLYIGKIKVWNKKVPDSFIDDALEKFKQHEIDKSRIKLLGNIGRLKSEEIIRRGSIDSTASESGTTENKPPMRQIQRSASSIINLPSRINALAEENESLEEFIKENQDPKEVQTDSENSSSDHDSPNTSSENEGPSNSNKNNDNANEMSPTKDMKTVDIDDHNRTMVLQIDRTDLRLISPDRKVILLHKHHRDVTTCVQGVVSSEHFGFICREGPTSTPTYIGYIFKCESPGISSDAVSAITQAFSSAESRPRAVITSCEHCPMVFFHKLCAEIEHMPDRKTQAAILRRLEQLDEEDQNIILTKFHGAETDSVREQNEFLMMLLRAHCEMKQGRHVHDTAENRSEFLNQYLGGGTIFMKAKRSLSNSFDQLLKRKSKDDFGPMLREMNLPLNRENSPAPNIATSTNSETSDRESEGTRSRTSTIGSQSDLRETPNQLSVRDNFNKNSVSPDRSLNGSDKGLKSPMMDIFLKVGSSPKSTSENDESQKIDAGSWRQAIFKRVITPGKNENDTDLQRSRTKEELRQLWRKSIHQAILLVRMERENAKLKAEQEGSAVKRIKLEYDEMKPNQREVMEVWELVTNKDTRIKCDNKMLLHAIRQGVPRGKRGEVWQFLAEQYCAKVPPIDTSKHPNYNVPYETLLKQLTSHQHAILIDLGRTFPNHSYFSSPLGPGQLALFNLLKAYSLLDPEVGYCQGLSFVAGVLLLHMEESQAFFLLRHLMFRRGLRKQYLPDMNGLQIKLYQISRLLHDQLPDLYDHFDFYEVAPTLYAAPWLLTIFASQFPLGFVTRVFDLVFLESTDVIFKVAIALLSHHRDNLLVCDSFEEIMNYMKTNLSAVEKPTLDKLMKQVFTTDYSKQLNEYLVEYNVLQEEMISVQPHVDAVRKLEHQNKAISDQNRTLMARLEQAISNQQRLEKNRTLQQSQINKLEMQNRGLEVTIGTLANFINNLIEEKLDVEIPDDVRRVMSQFTFSERKKNDTKPQNNLIKMFQRAHDSDKIMVKSLSTGKITLPSNLIQSELRSNSLNSQTCQDIKNTTNAQKPSQFFSSSHSNILQQKLHNQNSFLSNPKIDITIQEAENESNNKNNNIINLKNSENLMFDLNDNTTKNKSISLPLTDNHSQLTTDDHTKVSPTNSIDSGVCTPSSPKNVESHPLSNCDVNFSYGTRELKNIKNLRNYSRNSSPDMLGK